MPQSPLYITNRPEMRMDSVNHWLRAVDAEGLVLARTRVSGDWGFSIGRRDAAVFFRERRTRLLAH